MSWNAGYELIPADTDSPSEGADKIRDLKTEIRFRIDQEHLFLGTADSGNPGETVHREGSAVAYYHATAPTKRPYEDAGSPLYSESAPAIALGTNDQGRLWVYSVNNAIHVHTGAGGWVNAQTYGEIAGSARTYYQATAPGTDPAGTGLLSGRLWVDSDNNALYLHTGSAWNSVLSGGITDITATTRYFVKTLSIGDWNMGTAGGSFLSGPPSSSYSAKNVTHGVTWTNIRSINVILYNDAQTIIYTPFSGTNSFAIAADSTSIGLRVLASEWSSFTTSPGGNRGYITIWYII